SWTLQTPTIAALRQRPNLLIVQGDLQLSPNSLLPSDQFVIGGGTSLRGYRQNIRSGDNGFRFSVESRFTVARDAAGVPKAYLAPFFDLGTVWNVDDNPNQLPDQTFLLGAGLGAFWEPLPGLRLRVDYAVPFIDLDDRGDNLQDDGLYFNVNFRL
ncbi:MAG: ShlB/FhaC/HecB family hemolysin secretion/activation protein, partial [Coleofasciculaceae cyanobacterium SM2_3_26]|nr:ShlB/FhaC/HecB family hemolysin secretion/activation protein [Coleofasciculaceae cyanobacterium SM2_3_26]